MTTTRRGGWLVRTHYGAPGWFLVAVAVVLIAVGGAVTARAAAQTQSSGLPAHPTTVFIGDSYTAGVGASSPAHRWTTLVSKAEGWKEVDLGRGGTGYVTAAGLAACGQTYCPDYQGMVGDAVTADPDIVVVAGGQNDFTAWGQDPAKVRAGIASLYKDLRRELPTAVIYAVGPSTTGGIGGPVVGMDAAVRAAAKAQDAHYVSLISPDVVRQSMVTADGGHVDDAGHTAIADRVLAVVRKVEGP